MFPNRITHNMTQGIGMFCQQISCTCNLSTCNIMIQTYFRGQHLTVQCHDRGGYRILKGAGPRKNVGQKARMNFETWGTFSAKFAPVGALLAQNVPQLGHFLRKMLSSWGIFSVKCALAGALYAI